MCAVDDFQQIIERGRDTEHFCIQRGLVVKGDSLEVLKLFPDHSISLILTDPPYHTTQKRNIYGDTRFKEDEHYLEWMNEFAIEWKRILKPSGSLYCFCSSEMEGRLERIFAKYFNIINLIVWTKPNEPGYDGWKGKMEKEALRGWYPHSERIIFAEPAVEGNIFKQYFANVIRENRMKAGLSQKELTEIIGEYGKVNHGGAVSNWEAGRNIPSREQYQKMYSAIKEKCGLELPPYEYVIRPFMVDKTVEFTDIWTFPSVKPYKGKHPAEKPIQMLEHAIAATTYPDDIVLDCFAGSGSTAIAAMKLKRYGIAIEIEDRWYKKLARVMRYIEGKNYTVFPDNYDQASVMSEDVHQESLF